MEHLKECYFHRVGENYPSMPSITHILVRFFSFCFVCSSSSRLCEASWHSYAVSASWSSVKRLYGRSAPPYSCSMVEHQLWSYVFKVGALPNRPFNTNFKFANMVSCEMKRWLVHKLGWAKHKDHRGEMVRACVEIAQRLKSWSEDQYNIL
jgi:hypothetical protein